VRREEKDLRKGENSINFRLYFFFLSSTQWLEKNKKQIQQSKGKNEFSFFIASFSSRTSSLSWVVTCFPWTEVGREGKEKFAQFLSYQIVRDLF